VTPSVAVALFVESATLVAVTVMPLPGEFGATYVAVVEVCELNVPVDADQVTPAAATSFVTVAVKFNDCPSANPPSCGVSATLTALPEVVIVIVATALLVLSETEVAVNVTVGGAGTLTGALYVTATPEALAAGATVPHAAPLHPVPDTVHITPLFALSLVTVAVKFCAAPTTTPAVVCESVTAITGAGPAVTVMVADADLVPSETEVTVSVIAGGVGTLAGAV
jgi:hypothetical protein